jgi:hypothetical protein
MSQVKVLYIHEGAITPTSENKEILSHRINLNSSRA